VDQRLVRERPDAQRGGQLGAVGERHPLRGVVGVEAVPGFAATAGAAVPAHRAPVEDDEVTDRDVGDALADGLHRACGLVAEQERKLVVDAALAVGQVGVAHAARGDGDDRLARPRVGHDHVDQLDRRALAAGDNSVDLLGHSSCFQWVDWTS